VQALSIAADHGVFYGTSIGTSSFGLQLSSLLSLTPLPPPPPPPATPPPSLPTFSGVGVSPFGAVGYTPAVSTGGRAESYNVGLPTRSLHSSTFRLNVSTFCGILSVCVLGQEQETAQVELKSGRV